MPATADTGPAPLLVLNKITSILDAFSLSRPELTLADIRKATGLPTSTVQRLVGNLVANGFLDRTQDGYRVGVKMAYWAAPAAHGVEILETLKPVMKELRDSLGETVCFYQSSLEYRVCVAMAETHHMLRRAMHVGDILPLHAGSAGRVLLAYDRPLADRILAMDLDPLTAGTITDREILRDAIEKTRVDGYAITIGERESGSSGLSAPVFNAQADIMGALTIMGPSLRMTPELCESWVENLLEATERITRMIGGRLPGEKTLR
ncbi:DNA-binding IclR family transcriptional regulator [Arthrobacter pigmenti]|uniref:DNA-binding IclR family transcriptional regulator n=1 Tax=Arthrobacter pigmenti TaxID=271432 RepID=A0A846RRN3_9MICC|nr:IclR family transcriptional regulator [Arthrobacter pigmenti]NJC20971.1 DNA-binding IclR family transcriptional regulator [Arthrobacter pigmenti]